MTQNVVYAAFLMFLADATRGCAYGCGALIAWAVLLGMLLSIAHAVDIGVWP